MATGDITLTTPRTTSIVGLALSKVTIGFGAATGAIESVDAMFSERGSGKVHWVKILNGQCDGFGYGAGGPVPLTVVLPTGADDAMAALRGAGGKRAMVQYLRTAGLLVVAATVDP